MSKSIEEMTHDYVVAHIQAGHRKETINIGKFIELAEDVKRQARIADKEREEHARRDAKNGHY